MYTSILSVITVLTLSYGWAESQTWRFEKLSSLKAYELFTAPSNPNTLYGTGDCCLLLSEDVGKSWQIVWQAPRFKLGDQNVSAFTADPFHAGILFAGVNSGGLGGAAFKSGDNGASWEVIEGTLEGSPTAFITASPMANNVLYAGAHGGLYRSPDGGVQWEQVLNEYIRTIAFDLHSPLTLYAGGSSIFKSSDGGLAWSEIASSIPLDQGQIAQIVVDPQDSQVLYSLVHGAGIYKSRDGGINWTYLAFELNAMEALEIDPLNVQILYVGLGGKGRNPGIHRSVDGGVHWTLIDPNHVYDLVLLDHSTLYASMSIRSRVGNLSTTGDGIFRVTLDESITAIQEDSWGHIKSLERE